MGSQRARHDSVCTYTDTHTQPLKVAYYLVSWLFNSQSRPYCGYFLFEENLLAESNETDADLNQKAGKPPNYSPDN